MPDITEELLGNEVKKKDKKLDIIDELLGEPEKKEVQPKEKGFLSEMVSNIPGSAYRYGEALITPITSPIQTAKSLGKTALGAAELLIPGEQGEEKYAEAIGSYFKERYGGIDELLNTIKKDPVGFAGDLSTFLTGGGGIISKIGPLSKAGKVISKVGQALEPMTGAEKAIGLTAKVIPSETIAKMYESSAKFSTTLSKKERKALVNTALENQINASVKGVYKIQDTIEVLNKKITDKIDLATTQGNKIALDDLFKNFNDLEAEARLSGRPLQNLKAIKKVKEEIREANEQINRLEFTPKEAQLLKQKIYKDLESYYSSVRESPISAKAQKLVARNAKEAIENIIPEIKYLNKKEGALIELYDALEKSTGRIRNRDVLGIGVPIKVAAGGVPGGWQGALFGLTVGILDTPSVKSKLSLVLYRLKQKGVQVKPTTTAVRLGLFQAGREKEANSPPNEE